MELNNVKLTSLSSKGGCGCKIGPAQLSAVLQQLPARKRDPRLLVGLDNSDDAGVFQLNEKLALVQTVDFFTPIVDDPYDFGSIAAANALSDVYAMGGTPITALNIVAFPIHTLDHRILSEILRGAGDKLEESGATLAGGHSIDDVEPKFGLSVTGLVDPQKVWTNGGAQIGDRLILTKPIGVGILTTALKQGKVSEQLRQRLTDVMATLNRTAAEVFHNFEVHACTDVTGFGLLGHALEMARASKVQLKIDASAVPNFEEALSFAADGCVPGGTRSNAKHVNEAVVYSEKLNEYQRLLLCDAVTSGGLLVAIPEDEVHRAISDLHAAGVIEAAVIGKVMPLDTEWAVSVE